MYSLNGRTERQRIFNNWSIQENQLFFAASLHRLIGLSELTCTLAWPQLIPTGLEKKTKTNWECFAKSQANCPPKAGYTNWAEQTNNYQHVKSLHNCTALVILGISATNAGCHSKHSPLAFSAPDSSIAKCVIFMGGGGFANVTWCGDYFRQLRPDGHLCKWDPPGVLKSLLNILANTDKLACLLVERERERMERESDSVILSAWMIDGTSQHFVLQCLSNSLHPSHSFLSLSSYGDLLTIH